MPKSPEEAAHEPLVLIVEDELPMMRFLRTSLQSHGYRVGEARTGSEAIALAGTQIPDLIILDLGLPDMDGLAVTRRLREWSATPIIVVSARGQERDKIAALDAGADDYLTKPFSVPELLARLRVALRHRDKTGADKPEPVFESGRLRVDIAHRQVWVDGAEIRLTPIEYRLLLTLVHFAGRVLTHRQLLREGWGPAYEGQSQYLRIYMARLRHKIEADPSRPRLLLTEPGVGYRLRDS